jgi:hypothetical protein
MVTGIIKTTVTASTNENAKKIGAIFKNIAENVDENDLMSFYEKIHQNPNFLSNVIKKLENPLVKQFL